MFGIVVFIMFRLELYYNSSPPASAAHGKLIKLKGGVFNEDIIGASVVFELSQVYVIIAISMLLFTTSSISFSVLFLIDLAFIRTACSSGFFDL